MLRKDDDDWVKKCMEHCILNGTCRGLIDTLYFYVLSVSKSAAHFAVELCHDGTKVHLSQSSYFCFEGSRPRGRPKKTWKEVVREDCQARKLNKEDAMDRCKWRKMIKKHDDPDGCKWVNVSSGTGLPGLSRIKGR